MEECCSGGSKAEAEDRPEDVVEGQQDDPVCDPLPWLFLGVDGADEGNQVVDGEGEQEEDEEDEGIALRRFDLLHNNSLL